MARRRTRKSTANTKARLPRVPRLGGSGVVLATAVIVVLSLWLLAGFVGQVLIGAQQERRIAAAEEEVVALQSENNRLGTAIAIATSPAYAEQVAREQLGFAREGDTVILPSFPQTTPTPYSPTAEPIPLPTAEPNWQGWARAFFPEESSVAP